MSFDGYVWYVSSTATLLYSSYALHNMVAWIKVKPFFTIDGLFFGRQASQWFKWVYLGTLGLTIPVWIFEAYNNFCFNNDVNDLFEAVRPLCSLWIDAALKSFSLVVSPLLPCASVHGKKIGI